MLRLFFIISIIFTSHFTFAQDCTERPIKDIDCAAEVLLDDGLDIRAKAYGWNVYQWPMILKADTPLYSKQVGKDLDLTQNRDKYFFWVDQEPGGLFNHGTTFFFVDRKTGKLSKAPAEGFPIIDGVEYFGQAIESVMKKYIPRGFTRYPWKGNFNLSGPNPLVKINKLPQFLPKDFNFKTPTKPDVTLVKDNQINWDDFPNYRDDRSERLHKRIVRGAHETPQTATQAASESGKCDCERRTGPKQVLIVNGFSKGGERDTMDELARLYKGLGVRVTYLRSHPNEFKLNGLAATETTVPNIRRAFQQLAASTIGCCDEVEIYLGGHGSYHGEIEMNEKGREEVYDAGESYDPPRFKDIGNEKGGSLDTAELKELLNTIKSCQVKIFFHSCFSGSHLDRGLNRVDNSQTDEGCMCRTVYTPATAKQYSYFTDLDKLFEELKKTRGDLGRGFLTFQNKLRDKYKNKPKSGRRNPLVQSTDCILCKDSDGDGLINGVELKNGYSNPGETDSDGDGLDDLYEKTVSKTNPLSTDTDGDKLSDAEEIELGFDPNDADMDDDGLNDKYEQFLGTKPKVADSDGDGLNDGDEVKKYKTNPLDDDTDDDNIPDGVEVEAGTDPKDPESY